MGKIEAITNSVCKNRNTVMGKKRHSNEGKKEIRELKRILLVVHTIQFSPSP
jgi:hypothetical protein